MTINQLRGTTLLLIVALVTCICGCEFEIPTRVDLSNGPTFTFSGNGQLASFVIYAPREGHRIASGTPDLDTTVWQIKSAAGYFGGTSVHALQLRYGQIPSGYLQTVPSGAHIPPTLDAGVIYAFSAETTNAPGAGGWFWMSPRGPVQSGCLGSEP